MLKSSLQPYRRIFARSGINTPVKIIRISNLFIYYLLTGYLHTCQQNIDTYLQVIYSSCNPFRSQFSLYKILFKQ